MIGMDLSFPTIRDLHKEYPDVEVEYKKGYNPFFKKSYYVNNVFETYRLVTVSCMAMSLATSGLQSINCTEAGSVHGKGVECMRFEDYLKGQGKK